MLNIGDKITSDGVLGIQHAGIYIGAYGSVEHAVVHNSKRDSRVVVEALAAFGPYKLAQTAPAGRSWIVREAALKYVGTGYDLFKFNCEHFASFVQEGTPRSPQLEVGGAAVGLLALLGLAVGLAPRGSYDASVDRRRLSNGQFAKKSWLD
jgi:hypothetical protein